MNPVKIKLPEGARLRLEAQRVTLIGGINMVSDRAVLAELLSSPGIARFDPQEFVDAGFPIEEVRRYYPDVVAPGSAPVAPQAAPVAEAAPAHVPVRERIQFDVMTVAELRDWAKQNDMTTDRRWDKQDLVAACKRHNRGKE